MIYLDNSATTKPCQEAVEAVTRALTEDWGNPSALYGFGIDTARLLRAARHQVGAAMGAEPDRVFFRRHRSRQLGHLFHRQTLRQEK